MDKKNTKKMKNKIEINMASSGVDVYIVEKKIENGMGNENRIGMKRHGKMTDES